MIFFHHLLVLQDRSLLKSWLHGNKERFILELFAQIVTHLLMRQVTKFQRNSFFVAEYSLQGGGGGGGEGGRRRGDFTHKVRIGLNDNPHIFMISKIRSNSLS